MEYGESTGAFGNFRNEFKNAVDQLQIKQNTQILYDWKLVIDDSVLAHKTFKFNPPIPALKDGKIEIKSQPLEYLTQKEVSLTHTKNVINEDELSKTATDFAFGGNKLWMVSENNVFKKEAG